MKNKILLTIVMLFASYIVAFEPSPALTAFPAELYGEIITQSDDSYDAAKNFLKLRATSKTIQEKLDPSTENIIGKIAQKFNVDPLIPAFYIGTPVAKTIYKKRMQEQKKKLADANAFKKYLSNVLEQVLIQYNESKEFESLIKNLLANGAYFRVKSIIKIKEGIWLTGLRKIFVDEDAKVRRRMQGGDELPMLDNVQAALQEEYRFTIQFASFIYQSIGNKIVSLLLDYNNDGKIYCAITKLNLDAQQIGNPLVFTIPGKEGRRYLPISFYPQINKKGYVIALKSLPSNWIPGLPFLELFFVNKNGSNIKKIFSMSYIDDYSKDLVDIKESYEEYDGKPETPLFE